MKKLAKMAMLDITDAENAKSDIEKMIKMADILQELKVFDCIKSEEAGALRPDEAKDFSLKWGDIIVPKVVGE